jgi:hypothetical protein
MNRHNSEFIYLGAIWTLALAMQGCATTGSSLALGGGIGAGTGALVGAIADPGSNGQLRTRNVLIGTALGGMAGMVGGALLHDNSEEKEKDAYLAGQKSGANKPAPPSSGPGISQPKVDIQWVDGKVVGNRYIDGHYERIITEPTHWETDSR